MEEILVCVLLIA